MRKIKQRGAFVFVQIHNEILHYEISWSAFKLFQFISIQNNSTRQHG